MSTPNLKCHVFVCTSCTYQESNGNESSPEIAKNIRSTVKTEAVKKYGRENVRVSAVNCLGTCEHGISAVMYPQSEWKLNLREGDAPNLLSWIDSKMAPNS